MCIESAAALVMALALGAPGAPARAERPDHWLSDEAVFHGQVVEVEKLWSEEAGIAYTDSTIRLDHALWGRVPQEITLRTFGPAATEPQAAGEMLTLLLVPSVAAVPYRQVTRRDDLVLAIPILPEDTEVEVGPQTCSQELLSQVDAIAVLCPP